MLTSTIRFNIIVILFFNLGLCILPGIIQTTVLHG